MAIHGTIRSASDSTPVPGAVLLVYQITDPGSPDIQVATATSASDGSYLISYQAHCDKTYGLRVEYPHYAVACSKCPIWPLPDQACSRGDWPLTLWVE